MLDASFSGYFFFKVLSFGNTSFSLSIRTVKKKVHENET